METRSADLSQNDKKKKMVLGLGRMSAKNSLAALSKIEAAH